MSTSWSRLLSPKNISKSVSAIPLLLASLFSIFLGCIAKPEVACETDLDCKYPGTCDNGLCVAHECNPKCNEFQDCVSNGRTASCQAQFDSISIDSPSSGAQLGTSIEVTATLVRTERADIAAPETLSLRAKSPFGAAETSSLKRTNDAGSRFSKYSGTIDLKFGGEYMLTVSLAGSSSTNASVNIVVKGCDSECKEFEICLEKQCVFPFEKIAIIQPANKSKVNSNPNIEAKLEPKSGLTPVSYPASLKYEIFGSNSSASLFTGQLAKDSSQDYLFSASKQLDKKDYQGYKLVVSSAELADYGLAPAVSEFDVDATPPVLEIKLASMPGAISRTGVVPENWSSDDERAFRRDESVHITVTSSSADIDPSVALSVAGIGKSGAGSSRAYSLAPCSNSSSQFCGVASIDLWDFEMYAFYGSFAATATGRDFAGNSAKSVLNIPVTRSKWKAKLNGNAKRVAALGADGTIYIDFDVGGWMPGVVALDPTGKEKWNSPFSIKGNTITTVAIGEDASGKEKIFVAGANGTTSGALWQIDPASGAGEIVCSGGTSASASIAVGKTMFSADTEAITTVFAAFDSTSSSNTTLCVYRLGKGESFKQSIPSVLSTNSSIVTKSNDFFVIPNGAVSKYSVSSYGIGTGWNMAVVGQISNPIISESDIVISGAIEYNYGKLARLDYTTGADVTALVESSLGSPIDFVDFQGEKSIIAGGGTGGLYFFPEKFENVSNTTTIQPKIRLNATVRAAPVVGSDKILYVPTMGNKLYALDYMGQTIWQADIDSPVFPAFPTLDCARDSNGLVAAKPGVLYITSLNGSLHAIVTDSRGLDIQSPWPKFQKDPRNSGDATSDMSRFDCSTHVGKLLR